MIKLDFDKMNGLLPAIVQDYKTGEILMLGFMNQKAWTSTLATGRATFFSRSRQKLWVKGETSGNIQLVKEIRIDCDNDSVLLIVEQIGGATCHTGHRSCFFKCVRNENVRVIETPAIDPEGRYMIGEK